MKPFFDQILKNITEIFTSIIANSNWFWSLIIDNGDIEKLNDTSNKYINKIITWVWEYCVFLFNDEKSSENFRNISLAILGILGLALATWRSLIASNQWKTSEKQWRTAEEGQQTDRYQKAAQMLASENETERIGAIYALRDLVLANQNRYYITIMDLFCAYLRKPLLSDTERKKIEALNKKLKQELKQKNDAIKNEDIDEEDKQLKLKENKEKYIKKIKEAYPSFPPDRQLICEIAFATLRDFKNYSNQIYIEGKWRPYLEKAELINLRAPTNTKLDNYNFTNINAPKAYFFSADFSGAKCNYANFSGAFCLGANFSGAKCWEVNFSGADCRDADFSGADCYKAIFSGADCREADFSGADCYKANFFGRID